MTTATKPMHLAILTQYYPPEMGAPQTRLGEFTQRFTQRGHRVTVLTAMPNYPTGVIQAGYGGWFKRETWADADVIRTFIFPTQSASFVRRMSSYFSFVGSSALVGITHLPKADYLLVQSPPLFLGLSGMWLSAIKGMRMIFNVSDLWPDSAVRIGVLREDSTSYKLAQRLEALCYRRAWLVTGQSRTTVADIQRRFPDVPTLLITNGVDPNLFKPERYDEATRQRIAQGADCVAAYVGLHGLAQGLDQLIQAAKQLTDDPSLRFAFVGDGPEKEALVQLAAQEHCDNITFYPPIPKDDVPTILASSDIVLVAQKTSIPGTVPAKMYEAMASAKPMVVIGSGETADIVRDNDCGIVLEPNDIAGVVTAIQRLRDDPELRRRLGENGRRAAMTQYNRDNIAQTLLNYLEERL